jgi:hypothetical protein
VSARWKQRPTLTLGTADKQAHCIDVVIAVCGGVNHTADGVHAFDLACGQHRHFDVVRSDPFYCEEDDDDMGDDCGREGVFSPTSILLYGDDGTGTGAGARVLVVTQNGTVYQIDADSGAVTRVPVALKDEAIWWGAVVDEPTDGRPPSLLICDTYRHRIVRMSGAIEYRAE